MKITDKLIKASCSPTVFKRGSEYFKEGRVHLRRRSGNKVTAVVDGTGVYSVEAEYDEREITRCFCTCPYHQTMGTVCKHIVAVMLQRKAELEEGGGYTDENDRLAARVCGAFSAVKQPVKTVNLHFKLYINAGKEGNISYAASASAENADGDINGIENFLECYAEKKRLRLSRRLEYIPDVTRFSETAEEILEILAQSYLDKRSGEILHQKAVYQTVFGEKTAAKLFKYLNTREMTLVFNGAVCPDISVPEENPDILIDVFATDTDISLLVSERGTALTRDGEWFFFDSAVYHTTPEWRHAYMPIYSVLAERGRTQITFKGSSRIMFVKYVLPVLKANMKTAVQGVEDIVIDTEPRFEIYLDAAHSVITAVVIAYYGDAAVRLPSLDEGGGKIIIRDTDKENAVLDLFGGFEFAVGKYILDASDDIFAFVKLALPSLMELGTVKTTHAFDSMFVTSDIGLTATAEYNTDTGLLDVGFETNLTKDEMRDILSAIRLKKTFYRLTDGRFLDFSDDGNGMFKALSSMDFSDEDVENGTKAVPKYFMPYLNAMGNIEKKDSFKKFADSVRNADAKIPRGLGGVLREYQKTGILWLKQLSVMGLGGILADDMGLGKTLQVLAFIHGEKPKTPTLVVTPSAITYNWRNEIDRFIPDAKSIIIDGNKPRRAELLRDISGYEFVITSYALLRRDINMYKDVYFEYMFIDEAQNIKNEKTMNAHAVKKIRAGHKFAITGTPIENSLSELWSIFDYLMPGYMYSHREFADRYIIPITKENSAIRAEELRSKIGPFILRRMKSDVLSELPEKIEETIYADLTDPQKNMYSAFLEAAREETADILQSGDRIKILTLLMRLRQICCHPSLFDANYTKDSGKLNLLLDMTESAVRGGHRILIFSQFTSMLSIIQEQLNKIGISYFRLDGSTPSERRTEMSERFNGGERDVFLISLKAGGTGLNLIGADMVIHYDPWWNPAVTDQASDRAYRIGQTRAVQIIRLASRGTIEEKILRLQDKKRSLADDIITTDNRTLNSLSDEEIMELFR